MSDKVLFLKGMFPSIDNDVIAAILAQHNDDTEAATNDLLQLTNDSVEHMVAAPKPPPFKPTPSPSHHLPPVPQPPKGVGTPPFGGGGGGGVALRHMHQKKSNAHHSVDQEEVARIDKVEVHHDELLSSASRGSPSPPRMK